jgi:hypothetical protein
MADIFDEFRALVEMLSAEKVEYAVCGGWAMAIHGLPRATVDIDLLILTESLDAVWKIAEQLNYSIEGLPLSFDDGAIEIRRISKIDVMSKTLLTLDFLLVTEALENVWATRERIEFETGAVWTVSRDGLIYMKQISRRPRDLEDIERLTGDAG